MENETIVDIEEVVNFDSDRIPGLATNYRFIADGFKIKTTIQDYYLLIENFQQCCEEWGYLHTEDNINDFVGAVVNEVTVMDTDDEIIDIESHVGSAESIDSVFITFHTEKGNLQFVAYNAHNGYYGHEVYIVTGSTVAVDTVI
jgi:hypothetical protein